MLDAILNFLIPTRGPYQGVVREMKASNDALVAELDEARALLNRTIEDLVLAHRAGLIDLTAEGNGRKLAIIREYRPDLLEGIA